MTGFDSNDPVSVRRYQTAVRDMIGAVNANFDAAYDRPGWARSSVVVTEQAGTWMLTLKRLLPDSPESPGLCGTCGIDAWGFANEIERLNTPTVVLRKAADIMREYGQTHVAIALLEAASAKETP